MTPEQKAVADVWDEVVATRRWETANRQCALTLVRLDAIYKSVNGDMQLLREYISDDVKTSRVKMRINVY